MQQKINVNEWVALFKQIGLSQAQMEQWHHAFETSHPEAHQSFLEWLGMKSEDISRVRAKSR